MRPGGVEVVEREGAALSEHCSVWEGGKGEARESG